MICPNCKKDYRDVTEDKVPGHFYRSDDHFCKNYRRFGVYCTNCGFVAEMITRATGDPYRKRDLHKKDLDTINMFNDDDDLKKTVKKYAVK